MNIETNEKCAELKRCKNWTPTEYRIRHCEYLKSRMSTWPNEEAVFEFDQFGCDPILHCIEILAYQQHSCEKDL